LVIFGKPSRKEKEGDGFIMKCLLADLAQLSKVTGGIFSKQW